MHCGLSDKQVGFGIHFAVATPRLSDLLLPFSSSFFCIFLLPFEQRDAAEVRLKFLAQSFSLFLGRLKQVSLAARDDSAENEKFCLEKSEYMGLQCPEREK